MIAKVIVFMAITILLALGEYLYLYKQYSQKKILLFCILSGVIGFVSTQILLWHYQIHFMEILKRCILLMLLFPIALCDWKKMIIPNKILLFGLIVRIFLSDRTIFGHNKIRLYCTWNYAAFFTGCIFFGEKWCWNGRYKIDFINEFISWNSRDFWSAFYVLDCYLFCGFVSYDY